MLEWITTDDVKRETWRRLLEFANDEYTIKKIEDRFGVATDKRKLKNYEKQASQIRLSLIQAKEYLDSSLKSSLVTAPNLLYYATLSLCTATMLLNGDGDKSLDKLRQKPKSKHHGLKFNIKNENKIKEGLGLLENSNIKIEKEGFFQEWYPTVPETEKLLAHEKVIETNQLERNCILIRSNVEKIGLHELIGKEFSLIELVKRIPDLIPDLERLGVDTEAAKSHRKIEVQLGQEEDQIAEHWAFTGLRTQTDFEKLVKYFKINKNPKNLKFEQAKGIDNSSLIVTLRYTSKNNGLNFSVPEERFDINGNHYAFSNFSKTPEISDALLITYGLGMICRYYPDLWISELDSHSIASKIIENAIEKLSLKIPILALRAMNRSTTIISSLRPPSL